MEKEIEKIFKICQERREKGRKKYGDDSFKDKNMYQEMKEELYDVINYAMFEIIKISELEQKRGYFLAVKEAIDSKDEQIYLLYMKT
jgi:hypothetical protein